jgi:hypothetical protein
LIINRQTQTHNLLVTRLGKQKIILGNLWFKQTNPDINWEECTLGEQNRTKGNLLPNQQSKTRLIQKIEKMILSI